MSSTTPVVLAPSGIGGSRPNSGKKPVLSSKYVQRMRQLMARKLDKELDEILTAQIDLAKGVATSEKVTKDGDVVEVRESPDTNAARLLFEFTLGKPKETIQHTGGIGILHLVKQLEEGDEEEDETLDDDAYGTE